MISTNAASFSMEIALRQRNWAAMPVVPEPAKLSSTQSQELVNTSM